MKHVITLANHHGSIIDHKAVPPRLLAKELKWYAINYPNWPIFLDGININYHPSRLNSYDVERVEKKLDIKNFRTVRDIAKELNVKEYQIHWLIHSKQLECIDFGYRSKRIYQYMLDAYKAGQE